MVTPASCPYVPGAVLITALPMACVPPAPPGALIVTVRAELGLKPPPALVRAGFSRPPVRSVSPKKRVGRSATRPVPAFRLSAIRMSVPARSINPFSVVIPALAKTCPAVAASPAFSETFSGALTPVLLATEVICPPRLTSPFALKRNVPTPPPASVPIRPISSTTSMA